MLQATPEEPALAASMMAETNTPMMEEALVA